MRPLVNAPIRSAARLVVVLALAFAFFAADGATALAADDGRGAPADQGTPPPHTHTWVKQSRKEWVPPEKKVVKVGVDSKGKPIYETQIVKPGYWKTITWFACACGATRS